MELIIEVHKGKYYKIISIDPVLKLLEEHKLSLQSMKSSIYAQPFEGEVNKWEQDLSQLNETLELLLAT